MPTITLLFAALHALMLLGLTGAISRHRHRTRRSASATASDTELQRKIRVHGNFIEYVPLALLLLALLEIVGPRRASGCGRSARCCCLAG